MQPIITDEEYQRLMKLRKFFDTTVQLPRVDQQKRYLLHTADGSEEFQMNIERKNVVDFCVIRSKFNKSYQKQSIFRLEVNGRPHTNPVDYEYVGRNHIHIYKQGYGLRYAYDLENYKEHFTDPENISLLFKDICVYCNIEIPDFMPAMW